MNMIFEGFPQFYRQGPNTGLIEEGKRTVIRGYIIPNDALHLIKSMSE